MIPATINSSSIIDPSLARIDSQDESFSLPIRRFLEARGCEITTQSIPGKIPLYHIAAGDYRFVQKIFDKAGDRETRLLGIIINGIPANQKNFFHAVNTKIVLVTPRSLDAREVESIFAYFFTSNATTLNLLPADWQQPEPQQEEPITKQADEARIQKTMQEIYHNDSTITKSKPKNIQRRKVRVWSAFLLIMLFIVPIVWYAITIGMSFGMLAISGKFLTNGNVTRGEQAEQISGFWIDKGKKTLHILSIPVSISPGLTPFIHKQEKIWSLLSDMQKGIGGGIAVMKNSKSLITIFFSNAPNSEGDLARAVDQIRNSLFLVETRLGLAQAEMKDLERQKTFPMVNKISTLLAKVRSDTETMDNVLSLYQKIAGFSGKRTYLLLFQNSMELRPTGGFVGSLGLATFEGGRLSDLQIQDVYAVDGQLKGHVDPPKPIAELLSQEHWYLRDSNWDPNFSISGPKAAWFYEKETGMIVDGVIAINVPLLQGLLAATGPITLPDYNDRITSENFFGKSLYYTQANFFPGSTQKKDFLATLTTAIISSLTTQKSIDPFAAFRAFSQGLTNHDVLFSFRDPQLEMLVANLGWGGGEPRINCEGTWCIADPAILTEANLSVNKVNYFVHRKLLRQIGISESGKITETITASYQNTSVGDANGGGNYRTYFRLYVPADVRIGKIILNGNPIPGKNPSNPGALPYTEPGGMFGQLTGVAIAFDVPAGGTGQLAITYEHIIPLSFTKNQGSLTIMTPKQPGMINTNLETTVTYPIFWTITDAGAGKQSFLAKEAQLSYTRNLVRDEVMSLTFQK